MYFIVTCIYIYESPPEILHLRGNFRGQKELAWSQIFHFRPLKEFYRVYKNSRDLVRKPDAVFLLETDLKIPGTVNSTLLYWWCGSFKVFSDSLNSFVVCAFWCIDICKVNIEERKRESMHLERQAVGIFENNCVYLYAPLYEIWAWNCLEHLSINFLSPSERKVCSLAIIKYFTNKQASHQLYVALEANMDS